MNNIQPPNDPPNDPPANDPMNVNNNNNIQPMNENNQHNVPFDIGVVQPPNPPADLGGAIRPETAIIGGQYYILIKPQMELVRVTVNEFVIVNEGYVAIKVIDENNVESVYGFLYGVDNDIMTNFNHNMFMINQGQAGGRKRRSRRRSRRSKRRSRRLR